MAVTQYIGARYVPLFADPAEWDSTRTYEPLTIVLNQGNSYTSRQYVPAGVQLTDADYWLQTGNYSAQVEQYRSEVRTVSSQMQTISDKADAASAAVETETTRAKAAEQANASEITEHGSSIALLQSKDTAHDSAISTLQTASSKHGTDIDALQTLTASQGASIDTLSTTVTGHTSAINELQAATNDKFPIKTSDIAAGAVTSDKLSASALSALIRGMTIKYFSSRSEDTNADNTGMSVPATGGNEMVGFYVPELTLLVICDFQISASAQTVPVGNLGSGSGLLLPSYVPHISKTMTPIGAAIGYTDSNDCAAMTTVALNSDGRIGVYSPSRNSVTAWQVPGALVVFLRPYGVD